MHASVESFEKAFNDPLKYCRGFETPEDAAEDALAAPCPVVQLLTTVIAYVHVGELPFAAETIVEFEEKQTKPAVSERMAMSGLGFSPPAGGYTKNDPRGKEYGHIEAVVYGPAIELTKKKNNSVLWSCRFRNIRELECFCKDLF